MTDNGFDISFVYGERDYTGWVNPSRKPGMVEKPVSFHVILNDDSFGDLFFNDCNWTASEERPAGLVKLVGKEIEKHYQF